MKKFNELLKEINKVDFVSKAGVDSEKNLKPKHYLISICEELLNVSARHEWSLTKYNDDIYYYNSSYWEVVSLEDIKSFLGSAAIKMGMNKFDAMHYQFLETLYLQFLSMSKIDFKEKGKDSNQVCVNFNNGTLRISKSKQELTEFRSSDFIRYKLPYDYNGSASTPNLFLKYLDKVLPDESAQKVLAEFTGYIFLKGKDLKLEKALLLYGTGANGKSVFFEILMALLGRENVSNFSLSNLTGANGTYRAQLDKKLLNYSSEINTKLSTDVFKQLVSGEPVEARLLYKNPFILEDYAKFIFNCNELPKTVEQTDGFFRRFLIIPFDVKIPEYEQDKTLATKIIEKELSGVFNWAMDGLNRLLENGKLTECDSANECLKRFRVESDNIKLFLNDNNFVPSVTSTMYLKDIYSSYKEYCKDNTYKACSNKVFSSRMRSAGYNLVRQKAGFQIYIEKIAT